MEELMKRILSLVVVAAMALMFAGVERQLAAAKTASAPQQTFATRVERGRALVNFGGCHDCHTPLKIGANGPEPDMSRALSGHPAHLVMPPAPKLSGPWVWSAAGTNTAFAGPWGVSYTRNLTPDRVTGLGIWTEDMFIKTMRTGRHMGVSRPILPPMPWQNLNTLPDEDLKSIYAYLRTIKPIHNEVPDPIIAPPPPAPVASKK
jgi:mono/diheme cytochrome c family protein